MDVETSQALDGLRTDIRRLDESLDEGLAAVRVELRDGLAENRRHFEVLAESLRDDIRMIAEGLVVLGAKVDRLWSPRADS